MIPNLIDIGSPTPWSVLPPGIHSADLDEIKKQFAYNTRRLQLFKGIEAVTNNLWNAGSKKVYIDGSYVTGKPVPEDFDGCWDPTGVNSKLLDPVLLRFSNGRAEQKAKYGGEMFIATFPELGSGKIFLDFFQTDRFSGKPKGIILVAKP